MRAKVSLLLVVFGIIIAIFSFTMAGQAKMAAFVLVLIIAIGGLIMLLFKDQFVRSHRGFSVIIAIFFIALIIGYAFKILN